MKRFSDLQQTVPDNENLNINTQEISNQESETQFPDYMVHDTNFIGYQDSELQNIVYGAAQFGTIVTGTESVLDIGCGRGDFGNFLLERYPGINYTGVDFNNIMIDIGNNKYQSLLQQGNFNLQHALFDLNFNSNQTYDYVYHITDMTIDYGIWPNLQINDNRYEFLKAMIQKSYEICNTGMVFMLLNDKENNEGYISYSMTPISKILYDLNLKFAIDNSDIPNVLKLVVLKENF